MFYYWDDWNSEHITKHGLTQDECEYVVDRLRPPDPIELGAGKKRVWGVTEEGRIIQVIYAEITAERVDYEQLDYGRMIQFEAYHGPYAYVVHARGLNKSEKRIFHRRR